MNKKSFSVVSLLSMLACGTVACGDSDDSGAPAASSDFELNGEWMTPFSTAPVVISNTEWKDYATFKVVSFDNDNNFAITQNPPDDPNVSANTFARTIWTEPKDGVTYTCMVDFELATKEAAMASTKTADASDPETKGCGTFPWTKMTKK